MSKLKLCLNDLIHQTTINFSTTDALFIYNFEIKYIITVRILNNSTQIIARGFCITNLNSAVNLPEVSYKKNNPLFIAYLYAARYCN